MGKGKRLVRKKIHVNKETRVFHFGSCQKAAASREWGGKEGGGGSEGMQACIVFWALHFGASLDMAALLLPRPAPSSLRV